MQLLKITCNKLGGDRTLKGPALKKGTDRFLRKWSPHLSSCHGFALPEGYQTTCL